MQLSKLHESNGGIALENEKEILVIEDKENDMQQLSIHRESKRPRKIQEDILLEAATMCNHRKKFQDLSFKECNNRVINIAG